MLLGRSTSKPTTKIFADQRTVPCASPKEDNIGEAKARSPPIRANYHSVLKSKRCFGANMNTQTIHKFTDIVIAAVPVVPGIKHHGGRQRTFSSNKKHFCFLRVHQYWYHRNRLHLQLRRSTKGRAARLPGVYTLPVSYTHLTLPTKA